jgi:DNA-binding transcriptional LysR family regulator
MTNQEHPHDDAHPSVANGALGPPAPGSVDWTAGVDPRRLLVFRVVGREGSFAAAARLLGWTQPAVSQHVRHLERDLGMPLVTRVGRGLALTDPGRILLAHAEHVAAALASTDKAVANLTGLRSGRVRIAAFPSASATLVARAIGTLAAQHPDVDVHLTQLEPPEAHALLLAGDCEIALVFDYAEEADARGSATEATLLLEDPMHIVLPPSHPLRDRDSVALEELRGAEWVAGCPRCRRHLVVHAAAAGFDPRIKHSTDDYVVVQTLVATGTAVAVLPRLALTASRNPDVHVRDITRHAPRRVRALTLPGTRRIPAIAAALFHLREAARTFQDETSVVR